MFTGRRTDGDAPLNGRRALAHAAQSQMLIVKDLLRIKARAVIFNLNPTRLVQMQPHYGAIGLRVLEGVVERFLHDAKEMTIFLCGQDFSAARG